MPLNQENEKNNQLLINISHKIRTNLNGMIGFTEFLKDENLTIQERKFYIEIIESNSKKLLNFIDDLVDISKIQSHSLKPIIGECHLSRLIKHLEDEFNHIKKLKDKDHIEVQSQIPEKYIDLIIKTDCDRLMQIFLNLLENALVFSDSGKILFGFSIKKSVITCFVKDEGIGIEQNKLESIFDGYKLMNERENTIFGGTGFGLSISKGLVELLGGEISVISAINKGTTFEFTIPLKKSKVKQNAKNINPQLQKTLQNSTILIAEDEKAIQIYFREVFKNSGAILYFVDNGKAAINMYKETPGIDLVLMDIRMPSISGIEALEEILKINPKAKVIMQTAYATPDEKEKCYKIGCVDYITKPIIKETLFKTLIHWL